MRARVHDMDDMMQHGRSQNSVSVLSTIMQLEYGLAKFPSSYYDRDAYPGCTLSFLVETLPILYPHHTHNDIHTLPIYTYMELKIRGTNHFMDGFCQP